MYANAEEPASRQIELAAAKRNQRRRDHPIFTGMPNTVNVPDSLASQQAMDQLQDTNISMPMRQGSMPLAAVQQTSNGMPKGAIMTAEYRSSGGSSAPIRTVGCPPGSRCALQQGQGQGMTNPYNLGPGEKLIAINGIPVDGSAPQPMAAMPTAPAQPAVPDEKIDTTPEGLIAQGQRDLDRGAAAFPARPSDSFNATTAGRARLQAGLNMAQQRPELELRQRELSEIEKNNEMERRTQQQNLDAAFENTAEGSTKTIDAMISGTGKYAGLDADARARMAALFAQKRYTHVEGGEAFKFTDWLSHYQGKVAAYDIGNLIAGQGKVVDGNWEVQPGKLLPAVQQIVSNRYVGKQDGDKAGKILTDEALRHTMHQELDATMTRAIAARISKQNPGADPEEVNNQARADAYEIIEDLSEPVNYQNKKRQQGAYGVYGPLDFLNKAARQVGDAVMQPQRQPPVLEGLNDSRKKID